MVLEIYIDADAVVVCCCVQGLADDRMMQLLRLLNQLLERHPESRRRLLAWHTPIIVPVWPQVRGGGGGGHAGGRGLTVYVSSREAVLLVFLQGSRHVNDIPQLGCKIGIVWYVHVLSSDT